MNAREARAARTQAWRDLAALLNPAGRCADPMASGRTLDWHRIYAIAAGQGLAPTLQAVLAATPQRWPAVPAEVQQALAELQRLNAERNAQMREVLLQTVQCLNATGLEPLLLKGAIALFPGQYPHAGERKLGDLDLALQRGTPQQANAVLRAAGYSDLDHRTDPLFYDRFMHHHLAPLADPSGRVCIELHRALMLHTVPEQALNLAALREDAQLLNWDGLRLWVPSIPHRLLHNALHDAVQDEGFRSGWRSLRQLHEFARLREQPEAAGMDWAGLLARMDGLGMGEAVRAHGLLCEQLFAQPLPAGMQPGPAARASVRRFWFWIERPGLWPYYKRANRIQVLAQNALKPHWYPSKWRQLRQMWRARQTAV